MKLQDAKDFIKEHGGFRVEFETGKGGILESDHFPDDDEKPFNSEEEAWLYAERFAMAGEKRNIVNVYVIHAHDYTPVDNYTERKLNVY